MHFICSLLNHLSLFIPHLYLLLNALRLLICLKLLLYVLMLGLKFFNLVFKVLDSEYLREEKSNLLLLYFVDLVIEPVDLLESNSRFQMLFNPFWLNSLILRGSIRFSWIVQLNFWNLRIEFLNLSFVVCDLNWEVINLDLKWCYLSF